MPEGTLGDLSSSGWGAALGGHTPSIPARPAHGDLGGFGEAMSPFSHLPLVV